MDEDYDCYELYPTDYDAPYMEHFDYLILDEVEHFDEDDRQESFEYDPSELWANYL